jgi:hypothetical protein
MPSKPAFEGKVLEYMNMQKERYFVAIKNGMDADVLMDIQRGFLLRFDIDKPLSQEPSDEFLRSVNDSLPAPEIQPPDETKLSSQEYEGRKKEWKERQGRISKRKHVSVMEVKQRPDN